MIYKVRLWGDEFFAYQETEDGYLVIRDPLNGFLCYAQVLPDGSDIVSTGVRVGQKQSAGLTAIHRIDFMIRWHWEPATMAIPDPDRLAPQLCMPCAAAIQHI